MESQLQAIINNEFNNVRVVNWGQHGTGSGRRSDINSYHKMLDEVYQEGDIVIHIGENSWNGLCVQRKEQRYALANVLNKKPHLKCFVAGVAPHLNKEGYNLIANYIFDVIQEKLKGKLGIIRLLCPDKCLVHLFGFFYYEYRYFTWGGCVWRQKCRYQVNVKGHKTL